MDDGEMLAGVGVDGVDGFHAGIEANDKVVEVESQAEAVAGSKLFIESIEAELSSWLIGVVAEGPYVTCVDKSGGGKFPKYLRTQFG